MSTSLLNDLLSDHLDKGYVEAADRKAERARQGEQVADSTLRARVLLALGLLLAGFLLAVAYRATTTRAPESERARQGLLKDVQAGSATSDALQRQAAELSARLVRERDTALATSETGDQISKRVRELEAAAALVPVHGPGMTVVLGDAAPGEQVDPATGQRISVPTDENGRLRDRDLQSVVNALWAAGAEAISINGERLAPTTTIRAAGEAILVDLFPLSSPYTIQAVGNPDTLLPRFADTAVARRYQSLISVYGIRFTAHRSTDLQLRAATGTELRYAQPLNAATRTPGSESPGGTPSGQGTTGTTSTTPGGGP